MTPEAIHHFYARWRHALTPAGFHEGSADEPPESWLQWIWQQQRLDRGRLRLADGRALRVLHPGFWNHEAGPDFHRAMLQVEQEPPQEGDVEIDLRPSGWQQHGHDQNPAYAKVILHVIWERPPTPPCSPPILALRDFLEAPLEELVPWMTADTAPDLPPEQAGRCAAAWRELSPAQREELLQQAALVRLHGKALQLQHRARVAGWEQALWEGMFRALGYKHNSWAMQNLGELRPRLQEGASEALHWQARLLGVGGLLPPEVDARRGGGAHARQLWDWWWRERDTFADCLMPRSLWRLGGLRPANHPQRRLALAAHWMALPDGISRLGQWFLQDFSAPELPASLVQILSVRDAFWEWHWNLNSQRLARPQPLLGEQRATDLAVNVLLPWFYARALADGQVKHLQRAEARYLNWPAGEDNTVLKLARQRMLGGSSAGRLRTAAAQQGLLQIVRDCCDHATALCEPCLFPDLLRQFAAAHPAGVRHLTT